MTDLKDLFAIQGMRTTAGSRILENFVSPYDSNVWDTLNKKGCLLGGKLAMDEFAMGSFSSTSYFGKALIPGKPERSAGGCGAALADDLFYFTIGSDTGGSIRLPASFCSVYVYKPSWNILSIRYDTLCFIS